MVELDELTRLELASWLKGHKHVASKGMGTVRETFQEHPSDREPTLEPLIHDRDTGLWLIRWPNGSLKWTAESYLVERGLPVPTQALVAEVG